jgi:hypothetical protein
MTDGASLQALAMLPPMVTKTHLAEECIALASVGSSVCDDAVQVSVAQTDVVDAAGIQLEGLQLGAEVREDFGCRRFGPDFMEADAAEPELFGEHGEKSIGNEPRDELLLDAESRSRDSDPPPQRTKAERRAAAAAGHADAVAAVAALSSEADALLLRSFLQALRSRGSAIGPSSSAFPVLASTLFSSCILPCRPAGAHSRERAL